MALTSSTPESAELNLLRQWREPVTVRRLATDSLGSLLIHVGVVVFLTVIPSGSPEREGPGISVDFKRSIPLYIPKELTQRDPNQGKVTKELDVRSAPPPAPIPQAPRFRAPAPRPVASNPVPQIEAPSIDTATQAPPPPPAAGQPSQLPPPPDKPRLAFENVGPSGPTPRPNPNSSIKLPQPNFSNEDVAKAIQPSPSPSGVVVGDIDEATTAPSPYQAPSAGPVKSNLQLLSDPGGVDFKPYLIMVLKAVRTNWLAVIPESARMGGRRGHVVIQFIVDRRGAIPKLVIAESSGTVAFDRAAVAGVSASYPFPPLPSEFKGDEIRLQLAFSYNQPAR